MEIVNYILSNYYGLKEVYKGIVSNTILQWIRQYFPASKNNDIPYCSIALIEVFKVFGLYNRKLTPAAISWLNVGDIVSLDTAQTGDIVVLERVGGNHVGLLIRYSKLQNTVYILGFNQNNECNITPFNINLIKGIRRWHVIV